MEKQAESTPKVKTHSRKGLRRLFYFALVIGLILVGTPFGIQYGIIEGLTAAGSKQVKVEDVDFNPFTGVLAIKKLEARTEAEPELKIALLSVEVDWLPLFKQQIMIKSILLKGAHLEVEQGKEKALTIAGLKIPSAEAEEKSEKEPAANAWGIGLGRVHFVDNGIDFKSPDFSTDIKIADLSLAQLFSWKPGQAADFAFDTEINSAAVSGDFEVVAFSEVPTFKGKLKIDQFVLDDFITLAGGALNELKGKLSTDLSFSLSVEESAVLYQQQGSISLQDSTIGLKDIQFTHQKVVWDGDVNFALNNGQTDIIAKGLLALDKHQNSLNSPALETKIETASWNGEVGFKAADEKSELNVAGDFSATGLNSKNRKTKLTALQLQKLTVEGILIDQLDDIQLSKIVLNGLTVAQKQAKRKPLIKTVQISLDKLKLGNLVDLDLEAVTIDGLIADINIDKNGELVLVDELLSSLSSQKAVPKEVATQNDKDGKKPLIRVGAINVTGNSKIALTTATNSDLVKKKIQIKKLSIGEVNNQKPKRLTPFKLAATINKHSKFTMMGKVAPFTEKVNAQIVSKLKSFELPEFSPLIREELGYDIHSGQLDSDIKVKIKDDQLNGNIKIDIHKLAMESADPDKVAKMVQQLTMPLDSALSLLRDKNDDIELDIPIKGDISKPDFAVGDVINRAMGNALQGTVTTYLKYALQPYGLIYMAAEQAYGAATSISLEAVQFQPSEPLLSDQSKQYMERIGQLMLKRPGLRIRVCGFATAADRVRLIELRKEAGKEVPKEEGKAQIDPFHDALLDLAREREHVVKSHLVSTYQISEDRLFSCLPKIEEEKGQLPRVELLI
jgi:hypothetical protein